MLAMGWLGHMRWWMGIGRRGIRMVTVGGPGRACGSVVEGQGGLCCPDLVKGRNCKKPITEKNAKNVYDADFQFDFYFIKRF